MSGDDKMVPVYWTDWEMPGNGAVFVCEVPSALGRVTKLEQRNGKVVASTESGIEFIVPTVKPDQK